MRHWKLVLGFVLLSLGAILGSFLLQRKFKADALEASKKNLKELVVGIIKCMDDADGDMPPSIVYSKDGKPLYSWRVRILPYIGHNELYEKLKLDEPWDSPHNKPLLAEMPQVFKLPGVRAEEGTTFFQVFEGAGTLSSNTTTVRFARLFDKGTTLRLLIVEAADAVHWAAPGDIPYSDRVSPLAQMGRHLAPFPLCAAADGRVGQLTEIRETKVRYYIDLKSEDPDPWTGGRIF